jgi:hypothetical protein
MVDKTFRKSVNSNKNCGLISHVYVCVELEKRWQDQFSNRLRNSKGQHQIYLYYDLIWQTLSSSNYPIIPNQKNMIDGTLQHTYCKYDWRRGKHWLLQPLGVIAKFEPDLQIGFLCPSSLERPCGTVTPYWEEWPPQVAIFHVSTAFMLLVGPYKLKMKALGPFETSVCYIARHKT